MHTCGAAADVDAEIRSELSPGLPCLRRHRWPPMPLPLPPLRSTSHAHSSWLPCGCTCLPRMRTSASAAAARPATRRHSSRMAGRSARCCLWSTTRPAHPPCGARRPVSQSGKAPARVARAGRQRSCMEAHEMPPARRAELIGRVCRLPPSWMGVCCPGAAKLWALQQVPVNECPTGTHTSCMWPPWHMHIMWRAKGSSLLRPHGQHANTSPGTQSPAPYLRWMR